MKYTRGFTMVELIVVLALLIILAGLLVPCITPARINSRKVQCLNNLKQIGLGASMYASEQFFGTMPPGGIDGLDALYDGGSGIIGDVKAFACPSAPYKPSGFSGIIDDTHTDYNFDSKLDYSGGANKIIGADEPARFPSGALDSPVFANHGDGANFLFKDGHVKFYITDNPPDDSDSTSVYTGTSSATNTYID